MVFGSPFAPCSANQTAASDECIGRNELFLRPGGEKRRLRPYAYTTRATIDAFCGFLSGFRGRGLDGLAEIAPGGTDAAPDSHHKHGAAQPGTDRTCRFGAAVAALRGAARHRAPLLGYAGGCGGRLPTR